MIFQRIGATLILVSGFVAVVVLLMVFAKVPPINNLVQVDIGLVVLACAGASGCVVLRVWNRIGTIRTTAIVLFALSIIVMYVGSNVEKLSTSTVIKGFLGNIASIGFVSAALTWLACWGWDRFLKQDIRSQDQ